MTLKYGIWILELLTEPYIPMVGVVVGVVVGAPVGDAVGEAVGEAVVGEAVGEAVVGEAVGPSVENTHTTYTWHINIHPTRQGRASD